MYYQDVYVAKVWVWVPYSCYYHLYSKEELYSCAAKKKVSWIHTQGDSQEREFVSMMKQLNGSSISQTKYDQVRLGGHSVRVVVRCSSSSFSEVPCGFCFRSRRTSKCMDHLASCG
jgi:hypothetical protein